MQRVESAHAVDLSRSIGQIVQLLPCLDICRIGVQVAACASSRYVYEVFSGEVARVESEALVQEQSLLLAAARSANLWRKRPLASVHQMVIRAPDGQARTFRYGTESADMPAQVCYALLPSATHLL